MVSEVGFQPTPTFVPSQGRKRKDSYTVSLAAPNGRRGQNENKRKTKPSLPFLPYATSKHPFGELNVA